MINGVEPLGRFLIVLGVIIIAIGGLLLLTGKIPWIGRLPGDIIIHKKNYTVYFPLATGILLSLIITLILWFIGRK